MLRTAILLISLLFASVATATDLSLGEIRERLLNQEVVVLGSSHTHGVLSGYLNRWELVTGEVTTGFKPIILSQGQRGVPETLRGKRGIVISVEQAKFPGRKNVGELDSLGKPIESSHVMNPYIDVVVKVSDGNSDVFIRETDFYVNMVGQAIQLASRADSMRTEIEGKLTQLIGKKLYKAEYSELHDATLSLKEIRFRKEKGLLLNDHLTENLTVLKVVDAKFLEAENAVVIKIGLPSGEERILFGDLHLYDVWNKKTSTQLYRMGISAEEKVPAKFTKTELAAIKERKIVRGMSEDALYWSWGYPEKTNDWGRGGKQLIYKGSQYVYVDGKTVRDWQSIR